MKYINKDKVISWLLNKNLLLFTNEKNIMVDFFIFGMFIFLMGILAGSAAMRIACNRSFDKYVDIKNEEMHLDMDSAHEKVSKMFGATGVSWYETYRGKGVLTMNLEFAAKMFRDDESYGSKGTRPIESQVFLTTVKDFASGRARPDIFLEEFNKRMEILRKENSARHLPALEGIVVKDKFLGRGHAFYRWKEPNRFFETEEQKKKREENTERLNREAEEAMKEYRKNEKSILKENSTLKNKNS